MFLLYSIFIAGFKGKDCSVDIDLCSFGMCSEHTLICAETKGGHNVSCTCERGEQAFSSILAVLYLPCGCMNRSVRCHCIVYTAASAIQFCLLCQIKTPSCATFPKLMHTVNVLTMFDIFYSYDGWSRLIPAKKNIILFVCQSSPFDSCPWRWQCYHSSRCQQWQV